MYFSIPFISLPFFHGSTAMVDFYSSHILSFFIVCSSRQKKKSKEERHSLSFAKKKQSYAGTRTRNINQTNVHSRITMYIVVQAHATQRHALPNHATSRLATWHATQTPSLATPCKFLCLFISVGLTDLQSRLFFSSWMRPRAVSVFGSHPHKSRK